MNWLGFLDVYRRVGQRPVVVDGIGLRLGERESDFLGMGLCAGGKCEHRTENENSYCKYDFFHSESFRYTL